MAAVVKVRKTPNKAKSPGGGSYEVDKWIHVGVPTANLPQTTTKIIFRVHGGKVAVRLLVGEVTTIIQSSDPVLKITAARLTPSGTADDALATVVGTLKDIASTVDLSSTEVGAQLYVEGDGTALVKFTAGGGYSAAHVDYWVCPEGEIYVTTGASKTGQVKWDLWYQPLDEGAWVAQASGTKI